MTIHDFSKVFTKFRAVFTAKAAKDLHGKGANVSVAMVRVCGVGDLPFFGFQQK